MVDTPSRRDFLKGLGAAAAAVTATPAKATFLLSTDQGGIPYTPGAARFKKVRDTKKVMRVNAVDGAPAADVPLYSAVPKGYNGPVTYDGVKVVVTKGKERIVLETPLFATPDRATNAQMRQEKIDSAAKLGIQINVVDWWKNHTMGTQPAEVPVGTIRPAKPKRGAAPQP